MPGDSNATTTPAPAAGKEKKKKTVKKKRAQLPYKLLSAETVESLKAKIDAGLPGDTVLYMEVPTPPGVRKDKPVRRDYERGVMAELEAGNNALAYNNRALTVAQLGEEFRFEAAVKEEVIRKVTVKKV